MNQHHSHESVLRKQRGADTPLNLARTPISLTPREANPGAHHRMTLRVRSPSGSHPLPWLIFFHVGGALREVPRSRLRSA